MQTSTLFRRTVRAVLLLAALLFAGDAYAQESGGEGPGEGGDGTPGGGGGGGGGGRPGGQHWQLRDFGPLFWVPQAHPDWARQAQQWVPHMGCTADQPPEMTPDGVHQKGCRASYGGAGFEYRVWKHRDDRELAEDEFELATSFEHDDINVDLGTDPLIDGWHFPISGFPESQHCYLVEPEVDDKSIYSYWQGGWGGLQLTQHVGEWYQGRQYLPDVLGSSGGPAPIVYEGSNGVNASSAVTLFGFYDFDVQSRPPEPGVFTPGACVASAIYQKGRTGRGGTPERGRAEANAQRCLADSQPLVMRSNAELRCEPDLEHWEDDDRNTYMHDFRDLHLRFIDPFDDPECPEGFYCQPHTEDVLWWPPLSPAPYQVYYDGSYLGTARDVIKLLGVGRPSGAIMPTFPHNWRDECSQERSAVFGCGPWNELSTPDTELRRRAQVYVDDSHHTYGSRPLFRRFEVMIQMPGEDLADEGVRSYPQQWPSSKAT